MSRRNKRTRGSGNPVQVSIEYKPNSGVFKAFVKSTKEQLDLEELSIVIIDADRTCLSGYSAEHETNYISSYVYNSKKEDITVGVFDNGSYKKLASGKYQDIKGGLEGIKYCKPIFGIVDIGGENMLAELLLSGYSKALFSEWFDSNEDAAYQGVVTFTPSDKLYKYVKKTKTLEEVPEGKKVMNTYLHKLGFTISEVSDDELEEADDLEVVLSKYLNRDGDSDSSRGKAEVVVDSEDDDDDEDLPF
ncbi:MAG: hypothetical protein HRU18_03780 [Pseudoalteromonas sp.]|uniref:hypothetical protein n=1 Tax=Pseudoalteromonas sp. TaxID=53249 RepID=UPI001D7C4F84|nr:hypothetical protein [Pseudoalteromonas sp.]NRA77307.1 hypothetical protein [Pseudoalteromonas sp.]